MQVEQLLAAGDDLPTDAKERKKLYEAAKELMLKTEAPRDTHHRLFISWVRPTVQIGIDLGIFQALVSQPARPWTVKELADRTGAEDALLDRILRALAAHGTLRQVAPDAYLGTNITTTLAHDDARKQSSAQIRFTGPFMHALPLQLAKTGYIDTNDVGDSAFHMGHKTEHTPYKWLGENPEIAKLFFDMMPVQRAGQLCWTRQPEFTRPLLQAYFTMSADEQARGRVMFVDIGGGAGHQCIAIRENLPQLEGRIILEDLEWSAKPASSLEAIHRRDIEVVAHDFTKPQPAATQGAKVFYLRNVLHNWDDASCLPVLSNIRDAMVEDSIIVIDEMVMQEMNAGEISVNYDMIMMGFASKQRTEAAWKQLLGQVGLDIVEVRCYDEESSDCLIFVAPLPGIPGLSRL